MSLNVGRRLGPYEIEENLGAGGMGEVYKARDTRLNRTVAIKVLLRDISADPERRQRFHREAEAVAALSHPHICVLHDIGEDDGIDYLVMEHLEGETLATRLEHGPLPIASVLEHTIDIADALDKAHRAGVIHRDLKPSNVMLTPAGAKLLDFGLAKLRAAQGVMDRDQSNPTVTARLTREGTLLGTLQYMAPEQLEGKEADARTDVFAFGAVIYEMTSGRKAFEGRSDATLIGAILRDEPPPMSTLQPLTPRALERLVRTCLEKNADDRWQSAGDLKRELRWIREEQGASTSDATVPSVRRLGRVRSALIAAAGAVVGIVAVLVVSSLRETTDALGPMRFTIHLQDSAVAVASVPLAQISADGRRVAFIVRSQGSADTRIWIRTLDAQQAQPVSGTEGALALFWSPDSQQIAFATESALKRLTIGRTVETLCNDCRPRRGGTWSRNGSIVFPSQEGGLLSIPAAGGEPQPLTRLDRAAGEIAHIAPHFLPDGRRFLYVIRNAQANRTGLYVGQVGSNEPRLLLPGEHPAIYAAPGYLLFTRAGNIVAQPFDLRRLELSGAVTPLIGPSEYSPTPLQGGDVTALTASGGWPSFSASDTGVLTYAIAEHPESQFQWRRRAGEPLQLLHQPGPYMTFDLSPDGTRLVFARRGEHSSLWVIDLAREVTSPLTFGSSSYSSPRWASDGKGVAAHRSQPPPLAVVRILPDGRESVVSGAGNCMLDDISKDGQFVLCRPPLEEVLVAIPLSNGQKPITVRKAPVGDIDQAQFSPDGRWIAYNADDSGQYEVYLMAFPPTGERWPVSHGGGVQPIWRQDGRELYFLGLDGVLKAVALGPGDRPQLSVPNRLFDTGLAAPSPWIEQYAVSVDGQRFLILKPVEDKVRNSMGLILNWPALLQSGRSH